MARSRYPKHTGPPPPPLPPLARTVGQVIAESLKLYGDNFFASLVLGIPFAASTVLTHWLWGAGFVSQSPGDRIAGQSKPLEQCLVLVALAPFLTVAYVRACLIESGERISVKATLVTVVVGTIVFLPAAFTIPWFSLAGVVWLGVAGWIVPVLVHERPGIVAAFRRGLALSRADLAHAIGGLAALVIVYSVTRWVLELLLRDQAGNSAVAAAALADLVISPIVFLGAALLYRDLAARVGTTRDDRARAREEALAQRAG